MLPHLEGLHRFARRLTGREADAEDLVQQTYLDAFRAFSQLSSSERARAWLFQIARNLWSKERARRARAPTLHVVADLPEPAWPAGAIAAAEPEGFCDEVTAALDRLAEPYRTAVLLADVEDFTYEEIATVLGCPIGTVRSRIARGRLELAARLAEHLGKSHRMGGAR